MEKYKELESFSTVEEIDEIDDMFGNYGFKDENGNVVIKPQYASVGSFCCGLCPVCINRTWYRTETGREYYEMHWGYIDTYGKTVIPHKFLEAHNFNKYGVAVVCDNYDEGSYLIDTKGNVIENSRFPYIREWYGCDERFLEVSLNDDYGDSLRSFDGGMYDTKERKLLIETGIDGFIEYDEDCIMIYEEGKHRYGDFRCRFINSKGENIYPWQVGKGFSKVERPNKNGYSIVGVFEFYEKPCFNKAWREKPEYKYGNRKELCGVIDDKGEFVIPMEYDEIREKEENVFECRKGLEKTIIKL